MQFVRSPLAWLASKSSVRRIDIDMEARQSWPVAVREGTMCSFPRDMSATWQAQVCVLLVFKRLQGQISRAEQVYFCTIFGPAESSNCANTKVCFKLNLGNSNKNLIEWVIACSKPLNGQFLKFLCRRDLPA
jgi:hypothetical protein